MDRNKPPEVPSTIFENDSPEFYSSEEFGAFIESRRPEVIRYVRNHLRAYVGTTIHLDVDWVVNGILQKTQWKTEGDRLTSLSTATDRFKSFMSFMYRIAQNEVKSHARRAVNYQKYDKEALRFQAPAIQDPTKGEDLALTQTDELAVLRDALSQLCEADRAVLLGRADNRDYSAIAEELGCSIQTLRVRHVRAMQKLERLCAQLVSPKTRDDKERGDHD
jgi:RNA polymerase sigma factor (sigma-70 family)